MIGEDEDLPWDARDASFVRRAQVLQAKSTRMVFLMGRHSRYGPQQVQNLAAFYFAFEFPIRLMIQISRAPKLMACLNMHLLKD